MDDTDVFPRPDEQNYRSPDIQVSGDDRFNDPQQIIGGSNYMTDASWDVVKGNSANYVYLRAKCSGAIEMDTRLFCIPNEVLLYPQLYAKYSVQDLDDDDNPYTAIRHFSSKSAGVIVLNDPFNVFDPPDPGSGDPDSRHYCLVAEARASSDDDWPHEDPPTGADLAKWVLNNPNMIERNVSWSDRTGDNEITWQAGLTIPDSFSSSDTFSLQLSWDNVPVDGYISLTSTGDVNLDIAEVPIKQSSLQVSTASHTGFKLPYNVTVTIKWRQGTGSKLPEGATFDVQFNRETDTFVYLMTPELALDLYDKQPHKTFVGTHYPNLKEGGPVWTSRHKHLDGQSLLGGASPMPLLPSPGLHENLDVVSFRRKIKNSQGLGGDKIGCRT